MSSVAVYLKIESKKYLSFTFFKNISEKWESFKFTSYKSISFIDSFFEEVNKDIDKILSTVYILHIHDSIFSSTIIERMKPKSKNSRSAKQILNMKLKNKVIDKIYLKEYTKRIEVVMKNIEELKEEKQLSGFHKFSDDKRDDISLFGIVQHNTRTVLAVTTKQPDEHWVDYIEPRHVVLLVDDISKPVIIQQYNQEDRFKYKKAQPQIIAYLDAKHGLLRVVEGLNGYSIEAKDDIALRRHYNIDIDMLLAYYTVFKYEKESKEKFEALLAGAQDYSNYNIRELDYEQ